MRLPGMCSGGGGYTIGVQHGGGRKAAGVYGARWRQVYTTMGGQVWQCLGGSTNMQH
jgi:hypothetical protein